MLTLKIRINSFSISLFQSSLCSAPGEPTMATRELESPPVSHTSLVPSDRLESAFPRRKLSLLSIVLTATLLLALAAVILYSGMDSSASAIPNPNPSNRVLIEREVKVGVSAKSSAENQLGASSISGSGPFPWTNQMMSWQRTGFHFQPPKNWMNDPNGPMYYKGWYHFFYQYNPEAAVWGNIAWGHAVSKDLINWIHLPVALFPDRWYDKDGVWSGSATVLPDDRVIMLYTGRANGTVQVQNVAVPSNLSDPLLLNWTKIDAINPVMVPPPGVGLQDFRDPSTAWYEPSDASWRITIGSRDASNTGMALVYSTKDFRSYTLLPGVLHSVEHVGMWECIDLYPIAIAGAGANHGLDPSESPSPVVKHLLKASVADKHADYYSVGTYDPSKNTWVPDDVTLDVGLGLRYDYGNFYASKTFYDKVKQRRVLWGWVVETDDRSADIAKGWASLQGIPRSVLFDMKTGTHLLTWPVEEVETLRSALVNFSSITMAPGSTLERDVGGASNLDIEAEFEIDKGALEAAVESDATYDCSSSSGAADRGVLGPFGILVLANQNRTEQTATYFYVSKGKDGNLLTHFCQDELRSCKASGIDKKVVGHTVPVLEGETLSLRILVDHSIVESFAQGGRASITSRVYPTEAIVESARVYIFNYATNATVTVRSLNIWHMISAVNTNFLGSHNP